MAKEKTEAAKADLKEAESAHTKTGEDLIEKKAAVEEAESEEHAENAEKIRSGEDSSDA